jgi:trimeric autotransporter adhesin
VGTGQVNLALGAGAGAHLVGANSNNVDIANAGVAGDNGVVRIGTSGTLSSFFAAGIRGVTTGAVDAVSVVIDSNSQGTINSSRRYKEDIQDMGDASSGLMKLRSATYRCRQAYADGSKPIEYGSRARSAASLIIMQHRWFYVEPYSTR